MLRSLTRLHSIAGRHPIPLAEFDAALDDYHASLGRTGSPVARFTGVRALCRSLRQRFLNLNETDVPYNLRNQVGAKAALAYLADQDLYLKPGETPRAFVARYRDMVRSDTGDELRSRHRNITPEQLDRYRDLEKNVLGYQVRSGDAGVLKQSLHSSILRADDLICGIEVAMKVNRVLDARVSAMALNMMLDGGLLAVAPEGPFSVNRLYGLVNQLRASGRYIVTVYDAGMAGESQGFLAMKFMDRGSLLDNFSRLIWEDREVLMGLLIQIAKAVEEQHDQDVRRLDLTPGNILLHGGQAHWKEVQVGLIDLTGAIHGDEEDPYEGRVWGTYHYLPIVPDGIGWTPISRGPISHTKAWDTFSLGVIAYELLTGVTAPLSPVGSRRSRFKPTRLPAQLRPVIMAAVSDNPDDWYPDGGVFRRALESVR